MSSPPLGASPGALSPTEQQAAKHFKRPTSLGRHGSSWINRLHRHHDRKSRRPADDMERPLLVNDADETDDDVEDHLVTPSPIQGYRLRRFWSATKQNTRKAYHASRDSLGRNWKHILIACLLAVMTLLISLGIGCLLRRLDHKKLSTCQSAACVHAASEILYNLDPNYAELDACTQFDKMVCGGWELRHDLRPDQGDMFTGTLMAENSQTILRHILEQSPAPSRPSPADQDNFRKLKDDYDSCMNEQALQRIGIEPLLDLVARIRTSFPIGIIHDGQTPLSKLETKHENGMALGRTNPLSETLVFLIKLNVGAFLRFSVQADDRDPDAQILMVTPPRNIGLPSKEFYSNEELVREYQTMSAKVLEKLFAKPRPNTTISKVRRNSLSLNQPLHSIAPEMETGRLAQEIVDLEVQLAATTPPTEDQEDVTKYYNPMTIAQTNALVPEISFDHIISELAPEGYSPQKIIVAFPKYMTALSNILSETKKETVQAFLVWKAVQHYEKAVEDPSLEPLRAFNNRLRGLDPSAKEERWRTCINAVDEDLGWILSKFFIESAFSESAKEFGDRIVSDIKTSFITTLSHTEWMSPDVRARAIKKVNAIDQKIGYPTSNPNVLDASALQKYYRHLPISNSTHFTNRLHAARFDTRHNWNKLSHPTRHDEWGMTVPTVNAYYNPAGNEIVFPAGIMQAPVFYDASVPHYLTYGAFGAVAGHELSHAFDSTGSHYDETGNYTDWFDEATAVAFAERTQCFVRQYEEFSVVGPRGVQVPVNGQLTLGENIADAGGLHAAFVAWEGRVAERGGEALLPGLGGFTAEQLFFVSYGGFWCGKSTGERAVERIYTDPHAPKWARILGTVANSAEFKKAFKCKDRQPTCQLW